MTSIANAAREAAANLPKKKGELLFIAAFTLFYLEDYNVFSNSHVFALNVGAEATAGVNMISMAVTLMGFIALALLYQRKLFAISEGPGLYVCCGLIMAGALAWYLCGLFPNPLPLQVVGLLLSAFGHLCFLPQIVRHLAILGTTKSLVCYSFVMLLMALARPLIDAMPPEVLYLYLFVSPAAMLACLKAIPAKQAAKVVLRKESGARIPKTLMATMVLFGVLVGARMAVSGGAGNPGPLMGSATLVVAALLVTIICLSMKVNFNRLIYLMGLPVMCLGLLLFILPGYGATLAGNLVFNLGHSFFYGVLWALYSYLVRYSSFNYYWLPISAAIGSFLGRILGVLAFFNIIMHCDPATMVLPFAMAVTVLAIMLVSTSFCTRNNMRDGWGSIAPGSSLVSFDPFERNCEIVANNANLTPREADVMKLLAKGRNTQHIADTLYISRDTVKTHIKRIYKKMGVHSQQEVIDAIDNTSKQGEGE